MASIVVDDHIMLRAYEVAEAQELFDAVNRSRKHLNPWLDWVSKTTKPEHSLQFIQQSMDELHAQKALALGIFYDDKIIGGIGMHDWDHEVQMAQIGYWLAQEHEGKGIISRSMQQFVAFLFDKTGLNKIEIRFVQANKRSAKVAARMGFKIEGVIRQSVMRNGMPEDMVVTGLLKSEWEPLPGPLPGRG